ncbi:nucleoside hydrolase [Agromyces sp. ISL-38]|uniref:nucleoside hydrolase n=1 Tax=Agromyces sp. ISL-38 TaxID=2819107 RepID=UPI001BE7860B|nr:nucleoside hydrolase [Agromyces sp. ISL-38]MBT2498031.1 nucleoside hydrolase [Agromyces sp. ISL-38]MBT2516893.1 nucleoside hydrolase [Streptomyces sp. ISL-90]
MTRMHRVIFDTDLGSDVDDALALALLLGTPSVVIEGVTTVYGDTLLRARLAQRYASLAGRRLAVHAGRGATRSGREVWWAGHEGTLHEGLEAEPVDPEPAVDFLVRAVRESPGEIDVIAVGPLTDIAAAIERDPAFSRNVRHLWLMGGCFDGSGETEHNIRSDIDAAELVFASGAPITIAGLEATRRISMDAAHLERIAAAGALGRALDADIRQWWAFWNETWNVPHDPLTVLALVQPELCSTSPRGVVRVDADGRTRFTPDPDGRTRLVTDLDADAVAEAIVIGVLAASGQPASSSP